jgi:hypothetical protein
VRGNTYPRFLPLSCDESFRHLLTWSHEGDCQVGERVCVSGYMNVQIMRKGEEKKGIS